MKLDDFWKMCYEKDIVKSITIFIITSWTVIQVSSITHEAVGLPESFVSSLIIIFFLLLPLYIWYIWEKKGKHEYFALLSESEKAEVRAFKKLYFRGIAIVASLCLLFCSLIISNIFLRKKSTPELKSLDNFEKIAVLNFENNTGNPANDVVSKIASDWIANGIIKENLAQVISPEVIKEYQEVLDQNVDGQPSFSFIRKYLHPGQILTGSFLQDNGQYVFQTKLIDGENGELITSFKPERCSSDDILDCIEQTKLVVMTYLAGNEKNANQLEGNPPKFTAYKSMMRAKALRSTSSEEYLRLLNEAISEDSTYFEPRVSRLGYYYNHGEYAKADSLIHELEQKHVNNTSQFNVLQTYKYLLEGNNRKTVQFMKKDYELAPFNLESNNSYMILALQFVNKPELVPEIASKVDKELTKSVDCDLCTDRKKIFFDANNQLERYDSIQNYVRSHPENLKNILLWYPLISAKVQSSELSSIKSLLTDAQNRFSTEEFSDLVFFTINQYRLIGADFKNLYDTYKEVLSDKQNGKILYHQGAYRRALKLIDRSNVTLEDKVYRLALETKLGKIKLAKNSLKSIFENIPEYDFGNHYYEIARYYALTEDSEKCLEHLQLATKSGYFYTDVTFQNDPDFNAVKEDPRFKALLKYWW